MADVMKACERCKGDGFVQVPIGDVHPLMNVANARKVCPDGTMASMLDYSKSAAFLQFECRCKGRGILEWKRGKSLPPTLPSYQSISAPDDTPAS